MVDRLDADEKFQVMLEQQIGGANMELAATRVIRPGHFLALCDKAGWTVFVAPEDYDFALGAREALRRDRVCSSCVN